jgi:hypothetical protein
MGLGGSGLHQISGIPLEEKGGGAQILNRRHGHGLCAIQVKFCQAFVLCSRVFTCYRRTQKARRASQPDASGPGLSLTDVALATPIYS